MKIIPTPHSHISINGSDLESTYGDYIIFIKDASKNPIYFYVGQTGDAKHISARSSFYRIAAHLSYTKSTQNQIFKAILKETAICKVEEYEGLKKQEKREVRKKVEAWLKDKTIEMFFYKTADFEFLDEEKEDNQKLHLVLRKQTLALETALIEVIEDTKKYGDCLNELKITYKNFEGQMENARMIVAGIKFS